MWTWHSSYKSLAAGIIFIINKENEKNEQTNCFGQQLCLKTPVSSLMKQNEVPFQVKNSSNLWDVQKGLTFTSGSKRKSISSYTVGQKPWRTGVFKNYLSIILLELFI